MTSDDSLLLRDDNWSSTYKYYNSNARKRIFDNTSYIYQDFMKEAKQVCMCLKKTNPNTYSKYPNIKIYSEKYLGCPNYQFYAYNYDKSTVSIDKSKANTIIENFEKNLNLMKQNMDEINQAKIQFISGQWGIQMKGYSMSNYNAYINDYYSFITKVKSLINSSVAKSNLIGSLTILK